jgi:hypothetical protein
MEDGEPRCGARNEALRAIERLGRTIWRKWSGSHRRSRVEARMICTKLPGQRPMSRDFNRQTAELQIRIAILDRFTALGIPVPQPVGRRRTEKGEVRPSGNPRNRAPASTSPAPGPVSFGRCSASRRATTKTRSRRPRAGPPPGSSGTSWAIISASAPPRRRSGSGRTRPGASFTATASSSSTGSSAARGSGPARTARRPSSAGGRPPSTEAPRRPWTRAPPAAFGGRGRERPALYFPRGLSV